MMQVVQRIGKAMLLTLGGSLLVRKTATVALMGLAVGFLGTSQAQARTPAFGLQCDAQAHGVASFTVYLDHQVVFFGNSCLPGTGLLGPVPNIPDSAGTVRKIVVAVKSYNATGQVAYCDFTSTNGFVSGTCPTYSGPHAPFDALHVLVTIPNIP